MSKAAPRLHVEVALHGGSLELPERAARHAQVLRLQPGDELVLFDGTGGQWRAHITDMKRKVLVVLQAHEPLECEAPVAVSLALGMPANDNMDYLVEKATELGVAAIWPLECERSTLRLRGERIEKKRLHWQQVAIAACEQCGRNRVPAIHTPLSFTEWLLHASSSQVPKYLLDFTGSNMRQLAQNPPAEALFLSGPEGGLSPAERQAALDAQFAPVCLGPRVLRAETAPLVVLSVLNS